MAQSLGRPVSICTTRPGPLPSPTLVPPPEMRRCHKEFYKVELPGPRPQRFKLGVSGMEVSKPSPGGSWDQTGPVPISKNMPGLYDVCQGAARQGPFLGFITLLPASIPLHRQVWNGSR